MVATARTLQKADELRAMQAEYKEDLLLTEVDVSSAPSIDEWAQRLKPRRQRLDVRLVRGHLQATLRCHCTS